MGVGYNPKIVTGNLVMHLDFANQKNFNPSTNVVSSTFTNNVTWQIVNPQWVNFANNTIVFTRDSSASLNVAQKNVSGGCIKTTGNLYAVAEASVLHYTNFYYNDHTFEVWFNINIPSPSNYDATEAQSHIAGHRGYTNGFNHTNSSLNYVIWNGGTGTNVIFSLTVGASSQIKPNQWNQIVATRSGNTWRNYLNGEYASETTSSPAVNTLNYGLGDIAIGSAWENTTNYQWFSASTIGNVKMYNKALSNTEVQQNFNSLRGRFGI